MRRVDPMTGNEICSNISTYRFIPRGYRCNRWSLNTFGSLRETHHADGGGHIRFHHRSYFPRDSLPSATMPTVEGLDGTLHHHVTLLPKPLGPTLQVVRHCNGWARGQRPSQRSPSRLLLKGPCESGWGGERKWEETCDIQQCPSCWRGGEKVKVLR